MLHGRAFVVMLAGKTKTWRSAFRCIADGRIAAMKIEASCDVRNEGFDSPKRRKPWFLMFFSCESAPLFFTNRFRGGMM